ncbi:HAD family hydrolase [Terriglobus saanensis]|uniref:HAD-superfamily hydrolase, subfamily IA, variant 3 n=1 Tax=Terriglobus saanensis (strain ATCC BAA-1853 / DSM 23119 / SP1PR4) TaxID=401053 RepID=E8V5V2_TERSS|nr:HAD family phosphatase [Terriglobus saanensis]ADV82711.1 HAD-superfamily hydrolase, subfamily IA, variant 3 [Terriglobus saanensis SP1PR4]
MHDQVKAVLFDFGLVLSGPANVVVWDEMKRELAMDEATFHPSYWQFRDEYDRGTLNGTEYWNAVAGRKLQDAEVAELKRLDTELWTDMNEPMVAWAERLQKAGVKTGILSNIGDAMEDGIRGKLAWVAEFTHAVWSHQLKMRKPEPEIYAVAVKGLGVPAEQILFVDDREENIRGAEAAGMLGIVYKNHAAFLAEMERRDFLDLWGA